MTAATADAFLLLSIRPDNATRIFTGTKRFELRKALPRVGFSTVFLYESGRGLVGYFSVTEVCHLPIADLWDRVGERATTYERFTAYFAHHAHGYGIAIHNPVRFRRPLSARQLQSAEHRFIAPQSYLLVRAGDGLHALLSDFLGTPPAVALRPLTRAERGRFIQEVTQHIGCAYDDITPAFATTLLAVSDAGVDKHGFLTLKKSVLAICTSSGRRIGFATLTYKRGGSAKSGPVLLSPEYHGMGFGQATRVALERLVRSRRYRKLYCTVPASNLAALRYLLTAGYRIEAHLRQHYTTKHDELVLGKRLSDDSPKVAFEPPPRLPSVTAAVTPYTDWSRQALADRLRTLFSRTWLRVSLSFATDVLKGVAMAGPRSYESKPRHLLCLRSGRHCVGATVLIPKRGGAVKGMLALATSHGSSVSALISTAEQWARETRRRKLYFMHPAWDTMTIAQFAKLGFAVEGMLLEPYRQGDHAVVVSKLL